MSEVNYYEKYYRGELQRMNAFDEAPEDEMSEGLKQNYEKFVKFIESEIEIKPETEIFDMGCGTGHVLGFLKERGCISLCGGDISQVAINKAKKNYKGINFEVIEAEGKLPYKRNSFDLVFLVEVLEHVIDTEEMLKEVKRVLKPGGYLLVTTTEIYFIKLLLVGLFKIDEYFHPMSPHIRYFTRNSLRKLAERCGYKYVKYGMNGAYLRVLPWGQMVLLKK